jgi:hypothetical protein
MFLCKSRILASKGAKILDGLERCNNSVSMFIVNVIVVVKTSNN